MLNYADAKKRILFWTVINNLICFIAESNKKNPLRANQRDL